MALRDRRQDLVIARAEDRKDDFPESDHTFTVDDDNPAARPEKVLHVVRTNDASLGIREQPQRQIVIGGKSAMRLDRIGIDPDDFGARRLIALPVVAHATELFRADRGLIARVEEQDDGPAARVSKTPMLAVTIDQIDLRCAISDFRSDFHS